MQLVDIVSILAQITVRVGVDLGVRGADAFYIAIAQQLHLPLTTLDVDQRTRASQVIEIWEIAG